MSSVAASLVPSKPPSRPSSAVIPRPPPAPAAACTPAIPSYVPQPLHNGLQLDYKNLHHIEKEPFFTKADDPQFAAASNIGPKYDPSLALVTPRTPSASIFSHAARLSMQPLTAEEQRKADRKSLQLNMAALHRFEVAAEKDVADAMRAAVSPLSSPSSQAGNVKHQPAVKPSSVDQIHERLNSARKVLTRPSSATVRYVERSGGHWTDGFLVNGTSLVGVCPRLADRSVNARLPIYSTTHAYNFLHASPRNVSFGSSDRFPSNSKSNNNNNNRDDPRKNKGGHRRQGLMMNRDNRAASMAMGASSMRGSDMGSSMRGADLGASIRSREVAT